MNQATLIVMAAGIGSRFGGGIKQLEPVGPSGELIIDYSIYDAKAAGFDKVVFVIRKDLEQEFKERIGNRVAKQIWVEYAYQELSNIPERYRKAFANRKKPWGTGQAILACKDLVKEPFLVINADDYYGKSAYEMAYRYLTEKEKEQGLEGLMVAFRLRHTVSENGSVTRGICEISEEDSLLNILETKDIVVKNGEIGREEDGEFRVIDGDTEVSMNMWGFTPDIFSVLEDGFEIFMREISKKETWEKEEYLLPDLVGRLIAEKKLFVRSLRSLDEWFGVTYKEDKELVVSSIQKLIQEGQYPESIV